LNRKVSCGFRKLIKKVFRASKIKIPVSETDLGKYNEEMGGI